MATHNHNEGWRDEEGDNPTMYHEERETRKIWETYPWLKEVSNDDILGHIQ